MSTCFVLRILLTFQMQVIADSLYNHPRTDFSAIDYS